VGSASPRAVRVRARVRSLLRPPGRESLGSGEQETEAAIETPPSIGVLRGVGGSSPGAWVDVGSARIGSSSDLGESGITGFFGGFCPELSSLAADSVFH
jgi:hypothetical protein